MVNARLIGERITEARKKLNLSQAQVGERVFVSAQAVGKWERGESMPDIITLNRLAEVLGVDLNYFSKRTEPADAETASAQIVEEPSVESTFGEPKKRISWDMSGGNWVDADFSGLKNLREKFSSSNMQRCQFIGSDLSGLLLKSNNVDGCDFSNSDISNSQIQRSNLANNQFKACLLTEAKFSTSYMEGCDLSGANLIETEFLRSFLTNCDFTGVDFTGMVIKSGGFEKNVIADAVWNRTSFIDTHLADIVFAGALENCYFENCAFTRVTFQNATLNNTFFKNNSKLKRVRFIDCRTDRMTYEFLKAGKAELTGVTLVTP